MSKFNEGDRVTLPIFNDPGHRHGVVEIVHYDAFTRSAYYQVRRDDGQIVMLDEDEIGKRIDK
jgi:hypothetical protein